jgi:post-segregation antitoxin (ccd killing protein)
VSARKRGSLGDAMSRMQALRGEQEAPTAKAAPAPSPASAEEATPPTPHRRRITVYVRSDLYAQARAAVLDLGAEGKEPASISALLEGALDRELKRLAKKHRDGEPWPEHRGRLPGGRPPKG